MFFCLSMQLSIVRWGVENLQDFIDFRNKYRTNFSWKFLNHSRCLWYNDLLKWKKHLLNNKKILFLAYDWDVLVWFSSAKLWDSYLRHRSELGIVLSPDYYRLWIWTQLLFKLESALLSYNILRIDYFTFKENSASILFAEKSGFSLESTLKKWAIWIDWCVTDLLLYTKFLS